MIPENMPVGSEEVSCAVIRESIYITGYRIQNIVEFRPRLITFTQLNITLPYEKRKSLAPLHNLLVLIMADNVRHLTLNADVLKTFPGNGKDISAIGDVVTTTDHLYCMMADGTVYNVPLKEKY